jgi:hypothetical protein
MIGEETFRPNPLYRPLTVDQHRALADELAAKHRRLIAVACGLAERYRFRRGEVAEVAMVAADAVAELLRSLHTEFMFDHPDDADDVYTASLERPSFCSCECCQRQRQESEPNAEGG